jgi:hypothetical protein
MATSPTQRSLAVLRARAYTCEIVEHWNAFVGIRQDLFGFIDIVALGGGFLAVQTTSGSNVAARVSKITAREVEKVDKKTGAKSLVPNKVRASAIAWLKSGGEIHVHGWAKRGARGKPKVWTLREVTITLADFSENPADEGLTLGDKPVESGA